MRWEAPRPSACWPTAPRPRRAEPCAIPWTSSRVPGNVYVAAAKRAVNGTVGIDSEAGPTEIAIIADDAADPTFVAYDLLSQAEHDPMAGSVLITDSEALAEAVDERLASIVGATKHDVRAKEALTGVQSAIILTDSLDQSIQVADAYGAEHLEIHTRDAAAVAAPHSQRGSDLRGPPQPSPARRLPGRLQPRACPPAAPRDSRAG